MKLNIMQCNGKTTADNHLSCNTGHAITSHTCSPRNKSWLHVLMNVLFIHSIWCTLWSDNNDSSDSWKGIANQRAIFHQQALAQKATQNWTSINADVISTTAHTNLTCVNDSRRSQMVDQLISMYKWSEANKNDYHCNFLLGSHGCRVMTGPQTLTVHVPTYQRFYNRMTGTNTIRSRWLITNLLLISLR